MSAIFKHRNRARDALLHGFIPLISMCKCRAQTLQFAAYGTVNDEVAGADDGTSQQFGIG